MGRDEPVYERSGMRTEPIHHGEELHIAFCFNEKVVQYVLITVASCVRTAIVPYHFHFIYPETAETLLQESFHTFEQWRHANPSFPTCRFSFTCISSADYERLPSSPSLSKATCLRLVIDRFLPNLEKVLYLDSDIFVTDSLLPLWETELGETVLAAVEDGYIRPGCKGFQYLRRVRLSGKYFNAGVLLMNLPQWKAQRIGERSINEINAEPDRCRLFDQDALNILLNGHWICLDDKWNITSSRQPHGSNWWKLSPWGCPSPEKGIFHFMGPAKPWSDRSTSRIRFAYRDLAREVFSKSFIPSTSLIQCLRLWIPIPLYRLIRFILNPLIELYKSRKRKTKV